MERLLAAAESRGHHVSLLSTNGYVGMDYWTEARAAQAKKQTEIALAGRGYDLDITYTIPMNFEGRFLKSSRVKIGRYDFESTVMAKEYRQSWHVPDWIVGSSDYVRKIFIANGAPEGKVKIIHSAVDRTIFPHGGERKGKFKFLCVAEPHQRKQLDKLLSIYFSRFKKADDVILYLKTKLFQPGQRMRPYEIDVQPLIADLQKKYGAGAPEVKVISGHLPITDISKLYRACHAFVLPTASEGWGMPFLEAMSSGCLVVAPRHGGQIEFLSDHNSLLADCGLRPARPHEQYGNSKTRAGKWVLNGQVGKPDEDHFGDLMVAAHKNYASLLALKHAAMEQTSNAFSWSAAADQMLALADVKNADEIIQRSEKPIASSFAR